MCGVYSKLKLHRRLSTILRTSNKSVWSKVFWYAKVCIFWKIIQYTIPWDKTQYVKKISFTQNRRYKKYIFFLSRAPTHHIFTFNLNVCLGFPIFDSMSFLLNFIFFFSTKSMDSLTLKPHNFFQKKNNRKVTHSFAPRPLIARRLEIQWYLRELELHKSWPGHELFKVRKLKISQ